MADYGKYGDFQHYILRFLAINISTGRKLSLMRKINFMQNDYTFSNVSLSPVTSKSFSIAKFLQFMHDMYIIRMTNQNLHCLLYTSI